jgi:type III secretion protein C
LFLNENDWILESTPPKPSNPNPLFYSFDRPFVIPETPPPSSEDEPLNKLAEMEQQILNASTSKHVPEKPVSIISPFSERSLISQQEETAQDQELTIVPVPRTILINFNNVNIIEYIRFISRITNKNFIFDENDLQFNITVISEEPASIESIMAALLQELKIHDLILLEEGNNFIIHRNPKVSAISTVLTEDEIPSVEGKEAEIVTKVFRLNTLDPEQATVILRPLVSESAIIEILKETNHLIITDLATNIIKISQLLTSIDAPESGLVIGQYVVSQSTAENLIPIAQQIMQPIAQDQSLIFASQPETNSIFVVATPYLVERAVAVLQYLDQQQGVSTRILELQDVKIERREPAPFAPANIEPTPSGQWILGPDGNWIFKPEVPFSSATPPEGDWMLDPKTNWYFVPGKETPGRVRPPGRWVLDANGNWFFGLQTGEYISPEKLVRTAPGGPLIPAGYPTRAKFYIHRLKNQRGDIVDISLKLMADTFLINEKANEDLIAAIYSLQWIESSNSLIFSGSVDILEKIRELIAEVDVPPRQVLLEMLILETTIDDALNYSVNYGTRFGGGDSSGAQGFISGASPLVSALATTGVTGLGQPEVITAAGVIPPVPLIPNGTLFSTTSNGFNLGIIGQKITHCGKEFGSLGALVSALHDRAHNDIILNPKILTEDSIPAEVFVGINTPFLTQAISNSVNQVLTTNVQFRDVGTRLRVTPFIGNGDMITLVIQEEVTAVGVVPTIQSNATNNTVIGQTTTKNHTITRVHLPDGYFLVISGLLQDEFSRQRDQTPCLGAIPLLGALFSAKTNLDAKRNTMLFIRPKIIDTEDEIQHFTKHNQDMWDYRRHFQNSLEYEVKEALDFLNVRRTLYPSDCHDECADCDN